MCTENATPLNHCITHHRRLEHVSTAQYTFLKRSDIIRMSQPVWMSLSLSFLSLSLSSCFCSVSIHSPLLCCTSPQLPVFCSFGLFSLHLSLFLHSLLPLPPVLYPSICSRRYSCLCEFSCSGRAVKTPHTGAESFYWETQCVTEKQLFFTSFFLPSSLLLFTPCLFGICSLLCRIFSFSHFPHMSPLKINAGCSLRMCYQCCHILKLPFQRIFNGAGKHHVKADVGKMITVMFKNTFVFKVVLLHKPDTEM